MKRVFLLTRKQRPNRRTGRMQYGWEQDYAHVVVADDEKEARGFVVENEDWSDADCEEIDLIGDSRIVLTANTGS